MLVASKPLTRFVNAHPSVVILCLGFLLMIGFALVAEGFGFKVPKGYLYAAIGFSVAIESLNQIARRNLLSRDTQRPMRERPAEGRSEAHTSELQSLMRIAYAVFCLNKIKSKQEITT